MTISWQSSNTAIATVDDTGLVVGLAPGKVTITAATQDSSQKKATVTLTVLNGAERIAISGVGSVRGGLSATEVYPMSSTKFA